MMIVAVAVAAAPDEDDPWATPAPAPSSDPDDPWSAPGPAPTLLPAPAPTPAPPPPPPPEPRLVASHAHAVRPGVTLGAVAVGGAAWGLGEALAPSRPQSFLEDGTVVLDPDAWAGTASDVFVGLSFAAAALPLAVGEGSERATGAVIVLESLASTLGLTAGAKALVSRTRPYAVAASQAAWTAEDLAPYLGDLGSDPHDSFWSGHTSAVGASAGALVGLCFDAHGGPCAEPAWRWVALGGGVAATAVQGLLRTQAGAHYGSDVVVGGAVGFGVGLGTVALHRRRNG